MGENNSADEMNSEDVNIYWWAGMQKRSFAQVVSGTQSPGEGEGNPKTNPRLFESRQRILDRIHSLRQDEAEKKGAGRSSVPTPPPPKPEDFEQLTYDSFLAMTDILFATKDRLTEIKGPLAQVVKKGLEAMEDKLSTIAGVTYAAIGEIGDQGDEILRLRSKVKDQEAEVATLKGEVNVLQKDMSDVKAILKVSKDHGEIEKPFEQSPTYIAHCGKVATCDTQVKIPGLDMGQEYKLGHDERDLLDKVRAKLSEPGNGVDISNLKVSLLKKATKYNATHNKHTIPVIIHAKSRENRINMEQSIKGAKKLSTSYHWPKDVSDKVKVMREKLEKYEKTKDDGTKFSLVGKQLRIRPTEDGKFILIHYRNAVGCPWISLDSVKTPISEKMMADSNVPQTCESDYFSF